MKTLIASLILLLAVPARAGDRAPDAEAVARKHFETGQALSARGQYLEALAEFSAGYELSQKPLFLFNMAECARSAGQNDRARRLYQRYLAADPSGKLAPMARSRLKELGPPPPPPLPAPAAAATAAPAPAHPIPAPLATASHSAPPVVHASAPVAATLASEPIRLEPHRPLWKSKALWIGVGVGAAVLIVAGAVGGYYGTHGSDSCPGACVSFR